MFQLWHNFPFQARMPCPPSIFKLKAPAYQWSNCAGNLKNFQQTEWLNSEVDDKIVFERVNDFEILQVTVCYTRASVSFLSPKVFVRLPPKIQSSPKSCFKRFSAANQEEIRVKCEFTAEMKTAFVTIRHTFLVLEGSEAESLLGPHFLETHKGELFFSKLKLRFNRATSAKLFHRRGPVQSWHYPVLRVVARETSFIPFGHEAIIPVKNDTDDQTLFATERIFETSQSSCDKQNVMAFNAHSEHQEYGVPARIINLGEGWTIYKSSTLGTITILQVDTLSQDNAAIEDKQKHSGITKYDIKSVLQQAKAVLNEICHAKFAQGNRDFWVVFSKDESDIRICDLVNHRMQAQPGSTPVKHPTRRMPMHLKQTCIKIGQTPWAWTHRPIP